MLERWEQSQRDKGNLPGAEMARVLREQYGDEPIPNDPIGIKDRYALRLVSEIIQKGNTPYRQLLITLGLMKLGQTSKWLAEKIGIAPASLSRLTVGERNSSADTSEKIATHLEFSPTGAKELLEDLTGNSKKNLEE